MTDEELKEAIKRSKNYQQASKTAIPVISDRVIIDGKMYVPFVTDKLFSGHPQNGIKELLLVEVPPPKGRGRQRKRGSLPGEAQNGS